MLITLLMKKKIYETAQWIGTLKILGNSEPKEGICSWYRFASFLSHLQLSETCQNSTFMLTSFAMICHVQEARGRSVNLFFFSKVGYVFDKFLPISKPTLASSKAIKEALTLQLTIKTLEPKKPASSWYLY